MDIIENNGLRDDLTLNLPHLSAVALSGNYNDLINKPSLATVATTGSYADLINSPSQFNPIAGSNIVLSGTYPNITISASGGTGVQVQSDWDETDPIQADYIKNKPVIPAAQVNSDWDASSGVAQILNKPIIPAAQIQSDWNQSNNLLLDYIKNKPSLATVATSGLYSDLSGKPSIPAAQIQSDWNQSNTSLLDYIKNKPSIPASQIQSDWNQTNNLLLDYIKNKPSLATVATSGSYSDLSGLPTIPAQFNPIAGTNVSLSGTYPNITFSSTGGGTGYIGSLPVASTLGILSDGSDQTTNLNTLLSNANYFGTIIDIVGGGTITINGTVNANGKTLRFVHGSYINGTGTINGAIIDIDAYSQGFAQTITLTNCKMAWNYCSPMLFGAKGDNSTNDQPALQKLSDTMIANNTMPRLLWMPPLIYKITSPWILYTWNGTDYQSFNIYILGTTSVVDSNFTSCARLQANTITDTFAIGLQRAYGCIIHGLYIVGPFSTGFTHDTFFVTSFDSVSTTRDSRYSPNAGIVIDPFRTDGNLPSDGGYPGLSSWYRGSNSSTGGSSGVKIISCAVEGFTVDIMNTPNGFTQQGEDCDVIDCQLQYCNVAMAYGQSQTDNCRIINGRSWYSVWTVVDTGTYGLGNGNAPSIDGYNVAGTVKTLFNIGTNKNCNINDFYAESFFQIGTLTTSAASITVQNCNFDFWVDDYNVSPQYHITTAQNVTFLGCRMRYYDDLFNKRLRLGSMSNVKFSKCFFDIPPYLAQTKDYVGGNSVVFDSCFGGSYYIGMNSQTYDMGSINVNLIPYGNFTLEQQSNSVPASSKAKFTFNNGIVNYYTAQIASGVTITPSGSGTASFTATTTSTIQLNDILIDYVSGNVLGRISNISGSTVTISEIPMNITAGTYTPLAVYLITFDYPFVGDITSGSANITNCTAVLSYLPGAGKRINHPAFSAGTYIVSTSGTTITVSNNATKTAARQNFINGNPDITIYSPYAPGSSVINTFSKAIATGTKWIEQMTSITSSTSEPNTWIFNQGGVLNASALSLSSAFQSDFFIQYNYRLNSGTQQYFNNVAGAWQDLITTGTATLVSGVIAISLSLATTSSIAVVTIKSQGGTYTTTQVYSAVCTSGTLTISALTNTGSLNTLDTSTIYYFIKY